MRLAIFLCIIIVSGLLNAQNRPDLSNFNPEVKWGEEFRFLGGSMIEYFAGHDEKYIYFGLERYGPLGTTGKALSKVDRETLEIQIERDMTHDRMSLERAVMKQGKLFGVFRSAGIYQNRQRLSVFEIDKETLQPLQNLDEDMESDITIPNVLLQDNTYTFSPDERFMAITVITRTSRLNDFVVSNLVFDENMQLISNVEYDTKIRGHNYMDHKISVDNNGNAMVTIQIDGIGAGRNNRDSSPPYGFRTFVFEPGKNAPRILNVATDNNFIGSYHTAVSNDNALYFIATFREDHRDNARGFLISKMEDLNEGFKMINLFPFTEEFLIAISVRGEFVRSRGIDKLIMRDIQFLNDGSFVVSTEQSWKRSNPNVQSGPNAYQYLDDDAVLAHFSSDDKLIWYSYISKKQRFYELGRHGSFEYFNVGDKHLVMFNDALRNRDEYQRNRIRYTTNNPVGLFIGKFDDKGNFAKKPAFGEYYDGSTRGVVPKITYTVDNTIFVYQTFGRTARILKMSFDET